MAFYRNYNILEDILIEQIDVLFEGYLNQITLHKVTDNYELMYMFFETFKAYAILIKNLNRSNRILLILNSAIKLYNKKIPFLLCNNTQELQPLYRAEFLVGGLYQVLIAWAKDDMQESSHSMAKTLHNLLNL